MNSLMFLPINYLLPQFFQGVSLKLRFCRIALELKCLRSEGLTACTQAKLSSHSPSSSASLSSWVSTYNTAICMISMLIGPCDLAGQITSRTGKARILVWTGLFLTAVGYGLMYALLTSTSSLATQLGLQVLPGIGVGFAVQAPMMIIQAAMPAKDMAASMSAWILMRSIAAAVGQYSFPHSVMSTTYGTRAEAPPQASQSSMQY